MPRPKRATIKTTRTSRTIFAQRFTNESSQGYKMHKVTSRRPKSQEPTANSQWLYHGCMSFADTVVLFVLALLLFGPKKLPVIARQIGKALAEFKRASNEFKAQIEAEISQLELEERRKAESQQVEQKMSLPAQPPADSVEYLPAHARPSGPAASSRGLDLPPPKANQPTQSARHGIP